MSAAVLAFCSKQRQREGSMSRGSTAMPRRWTGVKSNYGYSAFLGVYMDYEGGPRDVVTMLDVIEHCHSRWKRWRGPRL